MFDFIVFSASFILFLCDLMIIFNVILVFLSCLPKYYRFSYFVHHEVSENGFKLMVYSFQMHFKNPVFILSSHLILFLSLYFTSIISWPLLWNLWLLLLSFNILITLHVVDFTFIIYLFGPCIFFLCIRISVPSYGLLLFSNLFIYYFNFFNTVFVFIYIDMNPPWVYF